LPGDGAETSKTKLGDRRDLTIRLSYDEGETWPVRKLIESGPAAYSDLAVLPDGAALCFYERGQDKPDGSPYGFLTLARFNLDWLTGGKDAE
jgi:sialidase-1